MDSDELRALIAVATTGSYHAAARALGFSRSTLRRRIGELEARVGRPLVRALSGGVALTAAGTKVVQRGQTVLRELDAMLAHLRVEGTEPTGELRLGMPPGMPPQAFHLLVSLLRGKFPKLSIRMRLFEDPSRAPHKELDAYLDLGTAAPQPGWSAHDIGALDEVLLASPRYLERRGVPKTIDALHDHELIAWAPPDRDPKLWPRADGTWFHVEPAVICPSIHVAHTLAEDGTGIALTPHADLRIPGTRVEGTDVVPVLPDLVRGPRRIRLKVSDEVAEISAFRTLIEFTLRVTSQIRTDQDA